MAAVTAYSIDVHKLQCKNVSKAAVVKTCTLSQCPYSASPEYCRSEAVLAAHRHAPSNRSPLVCQGVQLQHSWAVPGAAIQCVLPLPGCFLKAAAHHFVLQDG